MNEPNYEDSLERSSKPSSATTLLSVAERHFKIGEYPQALAVTDQVLQMDPNCIATYNLRSLMHRLTGDWIGLVADFTHLIRLQPELASHYGDRASALIELNQLERAIVDCNRAIELDPLAHYAYFSRGYALAKLGCKSEAVVELRKCMLLSAGPEFIDEIDRRDLESNLLRRAVKLIDAREYGQAIEACSAILCETPEHIEAMHHRGMAYLQLRRFEESSRDLAEAWRLKTQRDSVGRGYLVSMRGDRGEKIFGGFPDTPEGREEATDFAEQLAEDENAQKEQAAEVGETILVNIYRVEGMEVESVDWIWTQGDAGGPSLIIDLAAAFPDAMPE